MATTNNQIDIQKEEELQYWAEKLNSTPDEIQSAVEKVGYNAVDVEGAIKASSNLQFLDQYFL